MSDAPQSADLPIGIFDSGVGGLTVMRAIADRLPHEDLLYLGDTARVPYGNRGPDTVRRYAENATAFLAAHGIKALVVACNTATAFALDHLEKTFSELPVIGVVDPVSVHAATQTRNSSVGVIGTRGTIGSECYARALRGAGVETVHQLACPLFVPLAEEGWTDDDITLAIANRYLAGFAETDIDTLILGCTHYPLLRDIIQRAIDQSCSRHVTLLDSATATSDKLAKTLESRDIARAENDARRVECFATDDPSRFVATATRFFGSELEDVRHVDIMDVTSISDAPEPGST